MHSDLKIQNNIIAQTSPYSCPLHGQIQTKNKHSTDIFHKANDQIIQGLKAVNDSIAKSLP